MADRVVIVGAGRMGLALGGALLRAGALERLTYLGRRSEAPPHPLFDTPGGVVEYRLGPRALPEESTVLLLAVPDAALPAVAQEMALAGHAPAGCAALHLSGALSTDSLTPLHGAGYAVGSLHPLQAVADPWSSAEPLVGAGYAITGEPAAMQAARRLASALSGQVLVVPPMLRPLYHASASVASNYMVTLVSFAVRLMMGAGVEERQALSALLPLIRGTLDNLEKLGPSSALTGPISRGDVDTVRLHLARLSGTERSLYCALGRETLRLARAAGLAEDRAADLETLLADG